MSALILDIDERLATSFNDRIAKRFATLPERRKRVIYSEFVTSIIRETADPKDRDPEGLARLMNEMAMAAEANGLIPEELERILKSEDE